MHGVPLAGDFQYGGRARNAEEGGFGGYLLHAWKLRLPDGFSLNCPREFTAPFPDYWAPLVNPAGSAWRASVCAVF
jgi:23S rRNA-/tRNA-specific pseudouridylate synthase